MSKITDVADHAIALSADDTHGYNSVNRDGNPDYDYISFVCSCFIQSGIEFPYEGLTTTQEFVDKALSIGFQDVTSQVDPDTKAGIKKGDVVIAYAGPGFPVGDMIGIADDDNSISTSSAISNENQLRDGSGQPGDQTRSEIYTEGSGLTYDLILRYPDVAVRELTDPVEVVNHYIQTVGFDFADETSDAELTNLDLIRSRLNNPDLNVQDVFVTAINSDRDLNDTLIGEIAWENQSVRILFPGIVTGRIQITYMVSTTK